MDRFKKFTSSLIEYKTSSVKKELKKIDLIIKKMSLELEESVYQHHFDNINEDFINIRNTISSIKKKLKVNML